MLKLLTQQRGFVLATNEASYRYVSTVENWMLCRSSRDAVQMMVVFVDELCLVCRPLASSVAKDDH